MGSYIIKRCIYTVFVILVAGAMAFILVHLAPGDPAGLILGQDASVEQIRALQHAMGFDRPILSQFGVWLGNALRGDLGESIYFHKPVLQVIALRAEPTLWLTLLSTIIVVIIGVPTGIFSAVKYGSIADQSLTGFAIFSASIPSFWLGMLAILLFGVTWRVLPTSGYAPLSDGSLLNSFRYLVLPALCLGIPNSALILRVTRSSMLDELNKDYLRTARSKGLKEGLLIRRHALRNASVPIITVVGLTIASLIGGAVVTENVFAIPGLGRLVVQSVLRRDFPMIQGVVMLTATVYLVINLLVDLSYSFLDPRIRY